MCCEGKLRYSPQMAFNDPSHDSVYFNTQVSALRGMKASSGDIIIGYLRPSEAS